VTDGGAFGDDQTDTGRRAATVVLDHFRIGYATRGKRAGHRRHDHTGRQFEGTKVERFEQGLHRHWKAPQGMAL